MREKYLIMENFCKVPKSLDTYLGEKKTGQTEFLVCARYDSEKCRMDLWYSRKFEERIGNEFFLDWPVDDDEDLEPRVEYNSWRAHDCLYATDEIWGWFLARCNVLGYNLVSVRSFRRFTR